LLRHIKIAFFTLIFSLWLGVALAVSFNVSAEDEVYNILEEMEAVGAIDSQIYGIKPFTVSEVGRLLEEAMEKKDLLSPYLKARLDALWPRYKNGAYSGPSYLKPLENPYIAFSYVNKFPPENIRGRALKKNNLVFGFESKCKISSFFLLHSQFEFANLEGNGHSTKGRFLMGYGKIGLGKLALEAGVDSVWWGQAYTGTLLTSLNPPPYNRLIKLELENPVLLPWVFNRLGLFKCSFFLSRLEDKRHIPHPWLVGMKINFKPFPFLEIGINRSIMCGGKGRKTSLSKILWAKGENPYSPSKTEGDQKAGFDIRLRPFNHVVLYWEGAGEDEAGNFPSHWAHIVGVGAVGLLDKWGLRFEQAHISRWWYEHHVYKSGYRFRGRLIGYYTGRSTDSYFGEISYDINQNTRFSGSYWYEKYDLLNETVRRYQLGLIYHFNCRQWPLILRARYRFSDFDKANDHYLLLQLQINI